MENQNYYLIVCKHKETSMLFPMNIQTSEATAVTLVNRLNTKYGYDDNSDFRFFVCVIPKITIENCAAPFTESFEYCVERHEKTLKKLKDNGK